MKRSGLQKNIAFIFEDAEPAASNTAVITAAPAAVETLEPAPAAGRYAPSSVYAPAASVRPQPIAKKQKTANDIITPKQAIRFVKTRLASSKPKAAKGQSQKNMMLLMAVLAAVLVGVLIFVLGSSPSRAKAASKSKSSAASAAPAASVTSWKKPEPYPAALRDPMKWSSQKTGGTAEGDNTLVVRGIVYSQTKPTAIISGQIVGQGEVVSGATVVQIARDYVEFEKDNKRWKQQVER